MCKAHLSQLSEGHVNLFLIFESILVFTWKEKLRRVWWWRQRPNPKWLDPQDGEIWWWDNSICRFTSHSLGYDTLSIKFILFDFEVLSGPLCLVFVHMCAIFFAFGNATKVWVTIFLSNCMQLSGTALWNTLKDRCSPSNEDPRFRREIWRQWLCCSWWWPTWNFQKWHLQAWRSVAVQW